MDFKKDQGKIQEAMRAGCKTMRELACYLKAEDMRSA
jgi:hypothetical protein